MFRPTCVQVPREPESAHDTHPPVQAVSQQTPSTQLPNAHWLGAEGLHASPFIFFATHMPPGALQYVPEAQSLSVLQVLVQAFDAQTNGAHICVLATHAPPLHWPASLSVAVLWQVACEQVVPSGYFWQPPAPSHLPFVPQLALPWSTHVPFGSTLPMSMGEQLPALCPMLQAWHEGQLAVAQQTLSTQLPSVHWSPFVQAWPFAFFCWQEPPGPVQ
jgi:hypothetical protein